MLDALHVAGELRRPYERVLLLLELDRQRVAHHAALQVVHRRQREQRLRARRVQQLQAVEAADPRRAHGRREEALVDPVVFAAVARLVHALHAAARAVAALDRGLRLGLEAREVEVLLQRVDAEVVDDVAHEPRHARVVVGGVDEPAHETDLERHVPAGDSSQRRRRAQSPSPSHQCALTVRLQSGAQTRAHLFVKRMKFSIRASRSRYRCEERNT